MNYDKNYVPKLDLTPRLKEPLCLWNPLDYLRLLYWAFFFPQALCWYIKEFGKSEYQNINGWKKLKALLRNDSIQRRLVYQSIIAMIIAAFGIASGLLALREEVIEWTFVAIGVVIGVALGVTLGVAKGLATGVAAGMMVGVMFSFTGITGAGMTFGVVGGLAGGVTLGLVEGVAVGVMLGVVGGVVFGVAGSVVLGVLFFTLFILILLRLFDYVFLGLPCMLYWCSKSSILRLPSRIIFLPLPGIQKQLERWLDLDWSLGLQNANQMLSFSLQFIPVVNAVNTTLEHTPAESLLSRTASLSNRPFDWELVRFGSANLYNQLRFAFIDGLFLLPSRWQQQWQLKYPIELRFDTPSRAACAGFWLWHKKEAAKAVDAFAVVKKLPHGSELFGIANSILIGTQADTMQKIMNWEQDTQWLEQFPSTALRPSTLKALRILRTISGEARIVFHSQAPLNRSTAIGRANATLKGLIEADESTCLFPEWPLIKEIAEKWQDIFSKEGGVIGEEVLRQPVLNPYEGYSGLPVLGTTFTGRNDIMRRIENHWATTGQPVAIILYGHRRMGKTSILRNLANRHGNEILYVYLDMQYIGLIDHTGQLLLDIAESLHTAAYSAGLDIGPPPEETKFSNMGTGRRALNSLLDKISTHMTHSKRLVLAIDEFEFIETGIQQNKIDPDFLFYLRAINQQYSWLGLIFAGLHTLEEMGADYQSAFYGQAEYIRIGYMAYPDALHLITQPHPDFALEYASELCEELFRLSAGQPYLLQRLCWELVTRWNERFMNIGETTPRTLLLSDLEPILTPDFFQSAGYYFDGIWSNVTENERHLMRILATDGNCPCTLSQLSQAVLSLPSFQDPTTLENTLALLRRHDVIAETPEGLRIPSELMRQWISRQTNS